MSEVQFILKRYKHFDYEPVRDALDKVKALIFPELAPGEHHKERPEDALIAHDIHDVIRHQLAWDRNPEGGFTVDFDKPYQESKEALPVFKRVQGNVSD